MMLEQHICCSSKEFKVSTHLVRHKGGCRCDALRACLPFTIACGYKEGALVVAKFPFFKNREVVRRQWPELKDTPYNVFEQFPPEIQKKRRRLVPKMKEAKRGGERAWIAYDTLYIDGRPVSQ
ncbi:hypothetical protein DPMN_110941 [Dreissena polymorpha]|uniref:Uncharacterized protein n=1 Tax=Dreissena polymorpha TaxID=45954 RepID=A0A9D4KCZ3_DREPO|nr:hypothetical protein DPMN_110941 [Dreissena polymorpha]